MATSYRPSHQIGTLPFERLDYAKPQGSSSSTSTAHAHTPSPSQPQAYHSRFQYHANSHPLAQPPAQQSSSYGRNDQESYFPSCASASSSSQGRTYDYASAQAQGQVNLNIDDIVYRYSAEFDRTPIIAPGTPTVGVYARDGLWDDEDLDESNRTSRNDKSAGSSTNPATASSSRKASIASKARSRSNTVSANTVEEKAKIWTWGRPSMHASSPVMSSDEQEKPVKGLEKKKSKGLLRGKGRRGELSVTVSTDVDESFEAPPPIPATPASFFTESSPASFSSPTFSPVNYPSPMFETPASMATPPVPSSTGTTSATTGISTTVAPTKTAKTTSSWKRGMQKIFKSKSSAALRDAAAKQSTPPPLPGSLPGLPGPSTHGLGKPFSSSTPPLGESRRANMPAFLSTPPSTASGSFVLPCHPTLPHDPFASSLNLTSNNPSTASSPALPSPKPRPSLRQNSPSLRDLKNLLPIHTKPKLSKAKSLANLNQHHYDGPKSAPPEREHFSHTSKFAKRMSSLVGLNAFAAHHQEEPLEAPPSQASLAPPIESPPLLPPHPPFAGTSRSPSLPSITTDSSSSSEDSNRLSMPPSAPLPPVPSSNSSSNLAAPIQRSTSGAVLLPRSRSTSMSLKSPPTSSSFFDLYEQLGIWPNAEAKEKETTASESKGDTLEVPSEERPVQSKDVEVDKENIVPIEGPATQEELDAVGPLEDDTEVTTSSHLEASLPHSDSLGSSASWNIALNSFPEAPAPDVLDFGLPYVADDEGIECITDPVQPPADTSDTLSIMAVAASSGNSSHNTTMNNSMSTNNRTSSSTITQATSVGMEYLRSSSSSKQRRKGSGSGGSSRDSSPERRRSLADREASSDDSSSDEDDVPLSKLHPEAAAAQAQRREARKAARQAKKAQMQSQKTVQQGRSAKIHGRNPGGNSGWDGEGGVPADILSKKLEAVLIRRSERAAALALASAESHGPMIPQGLTAHRSMREQVALPQPDHDQHLRRAQTHGHGLHPETAALNLARTHWHEKSPLVPIQTGFSMTSSRHSPHTALSAHANPISPTDTTFGRMPSSATRRVDPAFAIAMAHGNSQDSNFSDRSRQNSVATSVSSRMPAAPHTTRAPSRQDSLSHHHSTAAVTRSNTTATQHSVASSRRARALSNAAPSSYSSHPDESAALHARALTEPLPPLNTVPAPISIPRALMSVPAFVSALNGKKIAIDLTSTTTAREVLVNTYHKGELIDAAVGMSWVLCEVFAELGCERQVREYEPLLPIVKGWDQTAKFNCFVFKQSNRGMPTWARAVPSNPPMLGSWVHYETKKGKWSKRWLETRGGQVFLAKNEKNKDEIDINILFLDIYGMTRPYDSPKPSTFILKRVEPAATFENASEYSYVFSCEDGLAFKLIAAIYDAKSYTLSHTHPEMISSQLPTPTASAPAHAHGSSQSHGHNQNLARRPTAPSTHGYGHGHIHTPAQPLVSLENKEDKSGFTGKGLLKI
ncbi:hypothetical protein I317_04598 [Kwoniella heveanensis CBS 569]|nr:hypothetical protein I317_04598 [Kwoniella heveanensis CBS 569]